MSGPLSRLVNYPGWIGPHTREEAEGALRRKRDAADDAGVASLTSSAMLDISRTTSADVGASLSADTGAGIAGDVVFARCIGAWR